VHPASARCPEPRLFGGRDGGLWEWPDSSCHSLVGSFKIEFFFFSFAFQIAFQRAFALHFALHFAFAFQIDSQIAFQIDFHFAFHFAFLFAKQFSNITLPFRLPLTSHSPSTLPYSQSSHQSVR
jgi:hypothetical protein